MENFIFCAVKTSDSELWTEDYVLWITSVLD